MPTRSGGLTMEDVLKIIYNAVVQIGLPVGLVIFFVWRDFCREKGLSTYIQMQESFTREKLLALIQTNTNLVNVNITCLRDFMQTIIHLYDTLSTKPCLSETLVKENLDLRMKNTLLEKELEKLRNE